jgi:hypothetical protein
MLRPYVSRVLFACLLVALYIAPVAASRTIQAGPSAAKPGVAIINGDCPTAGSPNCS